MVPRLKQHISLAKCHWLSTPWTTTWPNGDYTKGEKASERAGKEKFRPNVCACARACETGTGFRAHCLIGRESLGEAKIISEEIGQ